MAAHPHDSDTPGGSGRWSDLDRPPLRAAALREAPISPDGPYTALDVVEATGSTNADLVTAARAGHAAAGTVLIAEEQIAGRGRLGRDWVAPARSGLFFSVLLEHEVHAEHWGREPLHAGVAPPPAGGRAASGERPAGADRRAPRGVEPEREPTPRD